ncbi:exodeoxyribonuclease VII small subunit [Anatilimnocola floriformis]|uniref:exodeoxyribonuclease VII small subunit n=1 Tax=Anatilimnocola floriformis TaxID=2948575 RepID=UPI0020C38556|nr:exodeoxyribonuclease VII small subunit [Anatilimnocola floriformis]
MTQAQATQDNAEEITFEQSLTSLEKVVRGLEDGQQGLGASLQLYEQGIQHLQRCYQLLDAAEQKIELLTNVDEDGQATTESFDSDAGNLEEKTATRNRKRAPRS